MPLPHTSVTELIVERTLLSESYLNKQLLPPLPVLKIIRFYPSTIGSLYWPIGWGMSSRTINVELSYIISLVVSL